MAEVNQDTTLGPQKSGSQTKSGCCMVRGGQAWPGHKKPTVCTTLEFSVVGKEKKKKKTACSEPDRVLGTE